MNIHEEKNVEYLFEVLKTLESVEDCRILFTDLCTPREIEAMAQRMTAAKLLMSGKTYEQVIALTNISSATLSRVSRSVQYGTGYKKFIKP